ncbi:MAG: outer membrane protein transport protein, partial [Candidatus Aminicenantes bacterium]|nr:outer membrane protein transport protein [Candidatus Aminicenantes bacterium]
MDKPTRRRLPLLSVLISAVASLGLAATDYAPYDPGSRAPALGGAFVARADDVSALFANPAGLAFLKGLRFKTNLFYGQPVLSAAQTASGATYESNPRHFRGTLAASWQFLNKVTAGVGFFSPYHFSTFWPYGWPGNRMSIQSSLTST